MKMHAPSFVLGAATSRFVRKYWYIGVFYVLFYYMFIAFFWVMYQTYYWLFYRLMFCGIRSLIGKKAATSE